MNKLWKKLFCYFTVVSCILSIVVFVGFYGTFRYYEIKHHEAEMQQRAETIKERMEAFLGTCVGTQELDTYVKVLDDISMADAYFVGQKGNTFVCGCSCNSTYVIEKEPSPEVKAFADEVVKAGTYVQKEEKVSADSTIIYVGIPVEEDGEITATVVLVDGYDMDQESFLRAVVILLVCIICALLISAILASYLAKRFVDPIEKIANTIKALANENYDIKTDVSDHNEIGALARHTDVLAEKLDFASKESERIAKMQKDYIANVSHELRTPVAVIRSSLEALNDGMVPEDKIKDYQNQMLLETISLQRLVNDMLEISRLENEDFLIEKEQIDLMMVVEDAIRSIRMIAKEKSVQIEYNQPETECPIEGDYGRLRQMFVTVLDNAVKYSPIESKIHIESKQKEDYFYVSIADEGPGISEESKERIFDKFYHVGSKSGTGLGLAIMKNIAKRHDIEVSLNSMEGFGTKITFIIPIKK